MTGGVVLLNICHMSQAVCHFTQPGVFYGDMDDILAFDYIILVGEEDTDEGG